MPFPKLLLRRRLWVGIVCMLLFCGGYMYVNFVKPLQDDVTPSPLPVFHWLPVANTTTLITCRNSQQGHFAVVDELGYLCTWTSLQPSGCCAIEDSKRYECSSCLTSGCCVQYEHCVSCCLHPDKQPLLRSILSRSTETFHPLYSSLRDQFELCLSKCRTSSMSVQHENTYRNPKTKYCYGADSTTLLPEIRRRKSLRPIKQTNLGLVSEALTIHHNTTPGLFGSIRNCFLLNQQQPLSTTSSDH